MKKQIALAALAAAMFVGAFSSAHSQNFPSQPITFIYPFGAGSVPDAFWRAIGQEVGKRLGVTVIHENRTGVGGRIGLNAVIKSPPNGYTVGMISNGLAVSQPLIDPKLALEVGKDYTPVMCCVVTPMMLVARTDAPFKDLPSLVAYAKANPGKVNGSSSGNGTGAHLGLAQLNVAAGIDVTHVPYGGVNQALQAMLSKEVDLSVQDSGSKPFIESGKLVAIAVADTQRWKLFPEVPTAVEAGVPGFRTVVWHGVAAPPGLPPEVLKKLNQAFVEAVQAPDVRAKIEAAGFLVRPGSPEEFTAAIKAETEVMRPTIKAAKIKVE